MQFTGARGSRPAGRCDRQLRAARCKRKGEHHAPSFSPARASRRESRATSAAQSYAGKPRTSTNLTLLGERTTAKVENSRRLQSRERRAAHRAAAVQPDVQHLRRPDGDRRGHGLSPPRNRAGDLRAVQERASIRRGRKCRSASARSARRFATKSRRAISPSARASSSRWNWSSSSSPTKRSKPCTVSVAQWSEGADLSAPQPNWGWEMWHHYWVEAAHGFYEGIGLGADVLDYHWQTPEELAHYARACVDILFKFPFGTEELEGIAARSDFDLSQHQKHSGKPLEVFDEELQRRREQARRRSESRARRSVQEERPSSAAKNGKPRRRERANVRRSGATALQGPLRPARHRAVRRPRPPRARASSPTPITEDEKTDEKGKSETRTRDALSSARRADQSRRVPAAQEQARTRGEGARSARPAASRT